MPGEVALHSVPVASGSAARVFLCAATPQQRARFIDALRQRASIQFVDSLGELKRLLRSNVGEVDTVIVPARDSEGFAAEPIVREIALDRPKVAIVAYCEAGTQFSTDIRSLAVAGVHQIIFRGQEASAASLRTILAAARTQCAAGWVMQKLAPVVPSMLHPMVEAALAKPESVSSVRDLANALGVHRKTLFNRCDSARFLPPAELLAWCRLALVAYHLENTGCTIETIAIDLGFPSDTALRNAMKRYTGLRATEVRTRGGVTCVVDVLRERLRDWQSGRTVAPGVTLRLTRSP